MRFALLTILLAVGAWTAPSFAHTDATANSAQLVPSVTAADLSSASAPSLELQPGPAGSAATSSGVAAKTAWQGIKADVKTTAEMIARLSSDQRQKWDRAVAALPGFCHEWERLLHDREIDNLAHLNWKARDGYETATYTGYGKVEACEAKESVQGVPIGKVMYDEKSYYLVGKTIDEAKINPKMLGTTSTLEIFSWEKDRWFY